MEETGPALHPTTQRLVECLQSAANRCVNFFGEDDMIQEYKNVFVAFKPQDGAVPPLAGSSTEGRKLRNRLNALILNDMKELIDAMIIEQSLNEKFVELEKLKIMNPKNKQSWRPPGDVEQHMVPFTASAASDEIDELKVLVKKESEKLEILKARLQSKREKVQKLDNAIKDKLKSVEDSISVMMEKKQIDG